MTSDRNCLNFNCYLDEPNKLRHHLRLVSLDGLKMAAPSLDTNKWPEVGEELKRKEKAKDDNLKEMQKAIKDKNLDSLQVRPRMKV